MRTIILFLSFCFSISLWGQELNKRSPASFEIDCKKVKYDSEQDLYQFNGNVKLKSKEIVIKDADKLTYNAQTMELIAYGKLHFEFNGTVSMKDGITPQILRYKLQDNTLYLE